MKHRNRNISLGIGDQPVPSLYALMRFGFTDEAADYMTWLEARCRDAADDRGLQVLYTIDGNPQVPETTLDHLDGYTGSRPVRVGNSAASQLQLDVYGGLIRSRTSRMPRRSPAATNAHPGNSHTTTAPPSSPGRTLPGHDHRPDTSSETRPDPGRRPRRAPQTPRSPSGSQSRMSNGISHG